MAYDLTIEITGSILIPLDPAKKEGENHPPTVALFMGGCHKPLLGIRYEDMNDVTDTPDPKAQAYFAPGSGLHILFDLTGREVSLPKVSPDLKLGRFSRTRVFDDQKVGDSDLADVLNLTDLGGTLSGDPSKFQIGKEVAGRFVIDRGTLAALPLTAANHDLSFDVAGAQLSIAAGFKLTTPIDPKKPYILFGKSARGARSFALQLSKDRNITVSLSAVCEWDRRLGSRLDVEDFEEVIAGDVLTNIPIAGRRIGNQSGTDVGCPSARVNY